VLAGIGDLERRFNPGNPATDYEDVGIHWNFLYLKRFVEFHSHNGGTNNRFRPSRRLFSVLSYPGTLFSNVGHLEQEGVQTCISDGASEGWLMH
jgi:hypothetical protein